MGLTHSQFVDYHRGTHEVTRVLRCWASSAQAITSGEIRGRNEPIARQLMMLWPRASLIFNIHQVWGRTILPLEASRGFARSCVGEPLVVSSEAT